MKIRGDEIVSTVYTMENDAIGHITRTSAGLFMYHILTTENPTVRSDLYYATLDGAELFCMYDMVQRGYVLDRGKNRLTQEG